MTKRRLAVDFQNKQEKRFQYDYQSWYTKALAVVSTLTPDRHAELREYYEANPKRKSLSYGTFVIQDFLKGVGPNRSTHPDFDERHHLAILHESIIVRTERESRSTIHRHGQTTGSASYSVQVACNLTYYLDVFQ
jgi:hypothetical protein